MVSSHRTASRSHRVVLLLGLLVLGQGCQGSATAQPQDDPLGPIRCFEIVSALDLSSQSGLELCAGATSAMPGQCYAYLDAQRPELTDGKRLTLCQGATSMDSVACYERLRAGEELTEDQMIAYCATSCPVGPAPAQTSSPACFENATDRSDLSEQQATDLCVGSRSAGPANCFEVGEDLTELTESQLVGLCRQRYSCQYINGAPSTGY
jgi:hypothetical protein